MADLKFIKKLPSQVPSDLVVYSTERVSASQRALVGLARNLRLPVIHHAREFRYVDNWTISKHGAYTIAVNRKSGAMRLRDEVRHGREMDAAFRITERRLTDIARDYADKTKLLKLPARDLQVGKITYLRTQGASTTGEAEPEQILDAGVIFARQIDGVPVLGFGGHLMVNIAHDESVVGAVKIWRHRKDKEGKKKILKPDYAMDELKKRLNANGFTGTVNVVKADFCYFEAGDNTTQRYLEPSYAFVYETKVGDFAYKSVEVISAIERPRQKWILRKRYPREEKVRRG